MQKNPTDFARLLNKYFRMYLTNQRGASPGTITTYRHAFRLFLEFMASEKRLVPELIEMKDFCRDNVLDYLDWQESWKGCSSSTRNQRLAVMRSFATFIKFERPELLSECMQVLSIRFKKGQTGEIAYMKKAGMKLLLEQPDKNTSKGRRDHLLLSLFYTTGIRVSELTNIKVKDVSLVEPKTVKVLGKGNKIRYVPLVKQILAPLHAYLKEHSLNGSEKLNEFLFLNHLGTQFTRQGVYQVVNKYVSKAKEIDTSLFPDKVGCHTIRHSLAMELVNSGVDLIYIRDLLGHVSVQTTEIYAKADTTARRKAIESAASALVPDEEPKWENDRIIMSWLNNLTSGNIM
jgi:site-specific recombinase XerD